MVYSGQIYDDDGDLTFYENIDDSVHLVIDGQTVLVTQLGTSHPKVQYNSAKMMV